MNARQTVVVLSSYTAASRVGGTLAPIVFASFGIETILLPTTLLGRHPGRGAPGGGAIDPDHLKGMVAAVRDEGYLATADALLIGYMPTPHHVELAANLAGEMPNARILVDPILGDEDSGLYQKETVASAIRDHLLPIATDLVPNLYEAAWLLGRSIPASFQATIDMANDLIAPGQSLSITSVRHGNEIGALTLSERIADFVGKPELPAPLPNGTGDYYALHRLAHQVQGRTPRDASRQAVIATHKALLNSRSPNTGNLSITEIQNNED